MVYVSTDIQIERCLQQVLDGKPLSREEAYRLVRAQGGRDSRSTSMRRPDHRKRPRDGALPTPARFSSR